MSKPFVGLGAIEFVEVQNLEFQFNYIFYHLFEVPG